MAPAPRDKLLLSLKELREEELRTFKFKLLGIPLQDGYFHVPRGEVDGLKPVELADLLILYYGEKYAVMVVLEVLKAMHMNGVVETLGQDTWEDSRETYRERMKKSLERAEERHGHLRDRVDLRHRFTPLCLVTNSLPGAQEEEGPAPVAEGNGSSGIGEKEVHSIGLETLLDPEEEGTDSPRTVVLHGEAGIGKTTLAKKLMLDWASGDFYPDTFDYTFLVSCREINLMAEKSLAELICHCYGDGHAPVTEVLKRPERLLFIIDGLDELKYSLEEEGEEPGSELRDKQPVQTLLSSLVRKKLLPESSLLITTRPRALEKLQPLLEDPRYVEILGFSEVEREEYFFKFFTDENKAKKAFNFVQRNENLSSLCSIPLVCWFSCTCLKQQMVRGEPLTHTSKTITDVYMSYISIFLQPDRARAKQPAYPTLKRLCSLAADGIRNRKILFQEDDLRQHSLDQADIAAFLSKANFRQESKGETFYSFIHYSFQEFFSALYYMLEGDGNESNRDVNALLEKQEQTRSDGSALTLRFLFDFLSQETVSTLEIKFSYKIPPKLQKELKCIKARVKSLLSPIQKGPFELNISLNKIPKENNEQDSRDNFQTMKQSKVSSKEGRMSVDMDKGFPQGIQGEISQGNKKCRSLRTQGPATSSAISNGKSQRQLPIPQNRPHAMLECEKD
uniref:NLR family pyrin domain containing 10 n=1 Tax=Ornithorhynchus anatinus TaxID=9258 RepID=F6TX92_ORNAN